MPRAGLDSRVTDRDGLPVAERKFMRWFVIRRAAGSATGVELEIKIPGYIDEVSPHPTQNAADRAARLAYGEYREAVRLLAETA